MMLQLRGQRWCGVVGRACPRISMWLSDSLRAVVYLHENIGEASRVALHRF